VVTFEPESHHASEHQPRASHIFLNWVSGLLI
jgi:hypothetical protein